MVYEMTKKDTGMFSYHPFVYNVIDDVTYNRRECKSMFGKIVELDSHTEHYFLCSLCNFDSMKDKIKTYSK